MSKAWESAKRGRERVERTLESQRAAAGKAQERGSAAVERAEEALRKAQERLAQAQARAAQQEAKHRAKVEATEKRLAESTARVAALEAGTQKTQAGAARQTKAWVLVGETGRHELPAAVRDDLDALLTRRAKVVLGDMTAGRIFDALGLDAPAEEYLLQIPGRKGYVARLLDEGMEFVRN